MAVSRKVEQVIERGGEVKADITSSKGNKIISQKIRLCVLHQVDKAVADRPGLTRSAWIQEAIQEKLDRLNNVDKN